MENPQSFAEALVAFVTSADASDFPKAPEVDEEFHRQVNQAIRSLITQQRGRYSIIFTLINTPTTY